VLLLFLAGPKVLVAPGLKVARVAVRQESSEIGAAGEGGHEPELDQRRQVVRFKAATHHAGQVCSTNRQSRKGAKGLEQRWHEATEEKSKAEAK